MDILQIFWIIILISFMLPVLRKRLLDSARVKAIGILGQKRGTRIITLIHRQEALSFLGIPFTRFIDIEDSENILSAIRTTPKDKPIDLILHTPGGLVLAAEQIAMALSSHPAKVTVLIPHYAMSGGSLLALAADEIIMDDYAVLGPIDPQVGEYPAASILKAITEKNINRIDDKTLILADIARKAKAQVYDFVYGVLKTKEVDDEKAKIMASTLTEGRWTHDYPINYNQALSMGLPVLKGLPDEIHELMGLYPQAVQRRPSVTYVPLPYPRPSPQRPDKKEKTRNRD